MKNLAIIPARGGSKRIPRKNIKPFMGRPIIAYSIEAAIASGLFDEIIVSTDDTEIADTAKQFGAKIPFIRSEENSHDFATTADVIKEVLNFYQEKSIYFDTICCIYPTAPFVTPALLQEAYSKLRDGIDSAFSVVAYSHPIQRGMKMVDGRIVLLSPEYKNVRSQDLEPTYHDAGQFYVTKTETFLLNDSVWSDHTAGIVLSELNVQDLDTLTDWKLAEMKYELFHK